MVRLHGSTHAVVFGLAHRVAHLILQGMWTQPIIRLLANEVDMFHENRDRYDLIIVGSYPPADVPLYLYI